MRYFCHWNEFNPGGKGSLFWKYFNSPVWNFKKSRTLTESPQKMESIIVKFAPGRRMPPEKCLLQHRRKG